MSFLPWYRILLVTFVLGTAQVLVFFARRVFLRVVGKEESSLFKTPRGQSPGTTLLIEVLRWIFFFPMLSVITTSALAIFVVPAILARQALATVLLRIVQSPLALWILAGTGVFVFIAGVALLTRRALSDRVYAQLGVLWVAIVVSGALGTPLACSLRSSLFGCSPLTAVQWTSYLGAMVISGTSLAATLVFLLIVFYHLRDFILWKRGGYTGVQGFPAVEAYSKIGKLIRLKRDCRVGGRGQIGVVSGVAREQWFGGNELEITWEHGRKCPESISKDTYYAMFEEL